MPKTKFPYPPCRINPETEKPYTRHKWIIPTKEYDGKKLPKTIIEPLTGNVYYHVICARCKIRDPRPTRF